MFDRLLKTIPIYIVHFKYWTTLRKLELTFSKIDIVFAQLSYHKNNVWPCATSQIQFTYQTLIFTKLGLSIITWVGHLNCWSGLYKDDVSVALCKSLFNDQVTDKYWLVNIHNSYHYISGNLLANNSLDLSKVFHLVIPG